MNIYLETIGDQLDMIKYFFQKTCTSRSKIDNKPLFKPDELTEQLIKEINQKCFFRRD